MPEDWEEPLMKVLTCVSHVIDIILFPIYYILQQPWKRLEKSRKPRCKVIKRDEKSVTYRNTSEPSPYHVKMLLDKVDTVDKMLRISRKEYGTRPCLGTRKIIREVDEVQPNGRIFKKYEMGDYVWINYIEMDEASKAFGRGLRELGATPKVCIGIFAETRAEWMIAAQACFKQNIPIATVYATLGEEGIVHAVNETEVSMIITSHELLPKFKSLLMLCPKLETIVYMEDQLEKTPTIGFKDGVKIVSFTDTINKGKVSTIEEVIPEPDDTAVIMYTSGSTGTPKGVILTHRSCIATVRGFSDCIYPLVGQDVLLGFLPLAHIYELLAENCSIYLGVPIGYSTPFTLIDSSAKILMGSKGDATVLKPTTLPSVPLILDRISKGINDKVNSGTPLARTIFRFAYQYKAKWLARGFTTPLCDKIVFKKMRSLVGGRVCQITSGGAPMSAETQEFMKVSFCADFIQGFGMTETTASGLVMDRHAMDYGHCGPPPVMTDIRLENWEEGGYLITDKPNPRGELIFGGDCVSPGYFKRKSNPEEDFFFEDDRQWIRTGDIGEMLPSGAVKLIDRKKDLLKLSHGEYVSLGKVETELKTHPVVENICVYADSTKVFSVALIAPNQIHLEKFAKRNNISGDWEALCKNATLVRALYLELVELGQKRKLNKFEIPGAITLVTELWLPESGLVTAAFKLRRKIIENHYRSAIDTMYANK